MTRNPPSKALEEAFLQAYENGVFLNWGTYPEVRARFSSDANRIIGEMAEHRRKDWITTDRWNRLADETGICGELALQKAMEVPAQAAWTSFVQGLRGDSGADFITPGGYVVDCKATRGQALRFKFNRRNAFSNAAQIICFAHVWDGDDETVVSLLGWSWKADINRFMRDDERYQFVNFQTLRREGLVSPVTLLINE